MEINSFEDLEQALDNCEASEERTIRKEVDITRLIQNANSLEELNRGYDICVWGGFNVEQSKIYAMLREKTGKIASQLFEEKISNYEDLLSWLETVFKDDKYKNVSYIMIGNLGERIIKCLNERITSEQDPSKRDRSIQVCFDTFRRMQPSDEFQIRLNTGMNIIEGLEDVPAEYKEIETLESADKAFESIEKSEADFQEKNQRKDQVCKILKKLLLQFCNDIGSDEEFLNWIEEIVNDQRLKSISYSIVNLLSEKIVSAAESKIELAQDSNEKYRYIQIRNKTLAKMKPYEADVLRKKLGLVNTAHILNGVAFEDGALGITRDYFRIRAAREEETKNGSSYLIYPQDGLMRVTVENFNPRRDESGDEIDAILKMETGAKRKNIDPYYSEDTVAVLSKTGQPLVGFIREAKRAGNTTKIDFDTNYKDFLMEIQYPYSYKYQIGRSQNQKEYDTRIAKEFGERTSIREYPVKEDDNSNIETLKEIFGKKELDPRGIIRVGIGKQRMTRS